MSDNIPISLTPLHIRRHTAMPMLCGLVALSLRCCRTRRPSPRYLVVKRTLGGLRVFEDGNIGCILQNTKDKHFCQRYSISLIVTPPMYAVIHFALLLSSVCLISLA